MALLLPLPYFIFQWRGAAKPHWFHEKIEVNGHVTSLTCKFFVHFKHRPHDTAHNMQEWSQPCLLARSLILWALMNMWLGSSNWKRNVPVPHLVWSTQFMKKYNTNSNVESVWRLNQPSSLLLYGKGFVDANWCLHPGLANLSSHESWLVSLHGAQVVIRSLKWFNGKLLVHWWSLPEISGKKVSFEESRLMV